jgi:hypothetical protein
MLSSTISELLSLRTKTAQLIEASGMATAWRFEVHAVASGAPSEEQYLGVASACDLFVLIVADQQSDATEGEYESAFADNPDKILPFFVGEGSPKVAEFRSRIESRHARVKRDNAMDLVQPIASAVAEAVDTGRIIRPLLAGDLDSRIERARTLFTDVPLIVLPRIIDGNSDASAIEFIRPGSRIALSGIGGSGKTLCAAIVARHLGMDRHTLSLFAPANGDTIDIADLLILRISAYRLRANRQLIDSWAADGRICIVFDGVESLDATRRRKLLTSIADWSQRYPRCTVIVCARQFLAAELPDFTHVSAAPFRQNQIIELGNALGVGSSPIRMTPQLADIAQWPLWATALIVYGPQLETGLQLLQALIETRLASVGMPNSVEAIQIRNAAGCIASVIWPKTEVSIAAAMDHIASWRSEEATLQRFMPRSAEEILHGMVDAGLIDVGEFVSFPHRLVATVLAAEYAVDRGSHPHAMDCELTPFVAAVADDDMHLPYLLELLSHESIFTAARYLRLSHSRPRSEDALDDVQRLVTALAAWSPFPITLDVLIGDPWIAWRPATSPSTTQLTASCTYDSWSMESDEPIQFWASSPFSTMTPEFVSAIYLLSAFRDKVMALDPGGEPHPSIGQPKLQRLLQKNDELTQRVTDSANRQRALRAKMLRVLGIDGVAELATPSGELQATVWTSDNGQTWIETIWGGSTSSVSYQGITDDWRPSNAAWLQSFLAEDSEAAVYAALTRDIEAALGCRLGSQGWSRPELVQAWAW